MGMNNIQKLLDKTEVKEVQNTCKGLIYRCRVNNYVNGKGELLSQIRMIPLKRLSCKGCDHCACVIDTLSEDVANDLIPDLTRVVSGKIYKLIYIETGIDYETGVVDDWDWEFREVKEEK